MNIKIVIESSQRRLYSYLKCFQSDFINMIQYDTVTFHDMLRQQDCKLYVQHDFY